MGTRLYSRLSMEVHAAQAICGMLCTCSGIGCRQRACCITARHRRTCAGRRGNDLNGIVDH